MLEQGKQPDGIGSMISESAMSPAAKKLRATYAITPGAPLVQREFGFYCLERWAAQGMPPDKSHEELFGYDAPGYLGLDGLGWCEAAFSPAFEEKVLEDRGDYELAQDFAGRHVLFFKGRRSGFMPEYVDHPVKDMRSWHEQCEWRLDPQTPARYEKLEAEMAAARAAAAEGRMITQRLVGGYMYLRSLIGPGDLLYKFYDEPELIHACMQTWLVLAQAVISRHQQFVTIDELFIGEDICYNNGSLISPDMMREFLFPYYQELISSIKARQIDQSRHLFFQVDTDGWSVPSIPIYQELGMDVMSPFEVASGCDVVAISSQYPDLVMTGGIDKRILAQDTHAIDKMIDRIFPVMQARGGYIPTCDHGVPEEVPYDNYLHYRKRAREFA